jgi:uncharacterized protein YcnI
MRCSGWSSRAISASSAAVAALIVATLIVAAPAGAHLSIVPATVVKGELVDLVFSVPNEDDAMGVDHVTLGVPQDFELDDAEAKPGWSQSRTGQAVTWAGGNITKGTYARFGIRGTAPRRAETVLFTVLVGDRTGQSITYRVPLGVTAHGPRDGGARSLAKAAIIVAIAAAAAALAAGFVALYLWLRPPPL